MNAPPLDAIPLADVAPDAVELVRLFRESGAVSFQNVSVEQARANYVLSCAANGLKHEEVDWVEDRCFPVENGIAQLRLYRGSPAEQGQAAPLILFIHGGGWVIGDLDTHDGMCRFLANNTSAMVVAVDYRRSPEYQFPVPLHDCRDALHYVSAHRRELDIDLSKVIVVGDSAGANMATVLANGADLLPEDVTIAGQVLLYPVTDLLAEGTSYGRITSGFALTAASMFWFRDMYVPVGTDLADERLSPLRSLKTGSQPPLFIVTAGLDPLADEGIDYASKAAKFGTRVVHHHLPRHAHGLFTSAGKIATARGLLDAAAAFINSLAEA